VTEDMKNEHLGGTDAMPGLSVLFESAQGADELADAIQNRLRVVGRKPGLPSSCGHECCNCGTGAAFGKRSLWGG
jgi:hypothetical protein